MGSDSVSNAILGSSKDLGKKKRTRLAKLKQNKLDVRRGQWLSQVNNKGCKVDSNGRQGSPPSSLLITEKGNRSLDSAETRSKKMDIERSSIHDSEFESLMSSPVGSMMSQNGLMKDPSESSSISSSCCSGNVSKAEEETGCLDDWEAVADALTANEMQYIPNLEPPTGFKSKIALADCKLPNQNSGVDIFKAESRGIVSRVQVNCRAWHPDDVFRPQGLPNLVKEYSLPTDSVPGAINWACQNIVSQPSLCPICYEDLDCTDSSFLPCPCGFRLCLFCHKKILEADGRCPGCRKPYDPIKGNVGITGGAASFQICWSFSMSNRS